MVLTSEAARSRIRHHLTLLYPSMTDVAVTALADRVLVASGLAAAGESAPLPGEPGGPAPLPDVLLPSQDEVVLITYAGTLTDGAAPRLHALHRFWQERLNDTMSTAHLLPFFTSTSDGGFSVSDYRTVSPELGGWDDLSEFGDGIELMFDVVCNHGSAQSAWFENFRADLDPGRGWYKTAEPTDDLSTVVRPRTHDLLVPVQTVRGEEHLWATFSDDQIDFDFENPEVLVEFCSIVAFYLQRGATRLRLDAIAYLWKRLGTSCVHLAETHEVVKLFRTITAAHDPSILLVTETNVPHDRNISYFGAGDEAQMVYNFTLAPLVVWSLLAESATELSRWLGELEPPPTGCTFFNFIASHDGIGLRPVEDLLTPAQLQRVLDAVEACGGSVSSYTSPDGERPYELNVSLADLLAGPDLDTAQRFIAAHALMLVVQGIPAVYIHSLLTTPGDHRAVQRTGHKRDINRAVLDLAAALDRTEQGASGAVFSELGAMIRLRRRQSAFSPQASQRIHELHPQIVAVQRDSEPTAHRRIATAGHQSILALQNVASSAVRVALPEGSWDHDLIEARPIEIGDGATTALGPWQTLWLTSTPLV